MSKHQPNLKRTSYPTEVGFDMNFTNFLREHARNAYALFHLCYSYKIKYHKTNGDGRKKLELNILKIDWTIAVFSSKIYVIFF